MQPLELRQQVLHAYTRSISTLWMVGAPLLFIGALASVGMKSYSLERKTVKADGAEADSESRTSDTTAMEQVSVPKKTDEVEEK